MAAVFTEAQRAGLHALSEGTIDDQWIKGIRAGWKLLVKQTKKFKGRRSTAPAMEQSYLDAAADGSTAALQNVQRYIGRLRDDLLLNKGFWDLPSDAQGKKELSIIRRYKTKVIDELDAAEEAISDGLSYARTVKEAASKDGGIGGREGYMHQETYASQDRFNFTLNGFGERLDGIMTMADKAISGRLFRHLSKVLATSFKHVLDYPTKGSEKWRSKKRYVKKQVPLDWGEHEPPVVHLGKATVIFQDMPGEGAGGTISPRKVGSETTVKKGGEVVTTKEVTSRTKYGGGYMHPRDRKEFVDGLKEAQARLRAKRLGKLFHGHFLIEPKERAGTNQYGAHLGVGGRYYRKGDAIHLYGGSKGPHSVAVVAIHEIGHRYYYKNLTSQDRHNFDKWFKDVPAVSSYGGINPAEDFAEVFTHYVLGQDMTKDQMQRFRQFMTGHRPRTEAMEESAATKSQECMFCDEPAVSSLIWEDGQNYVAVCRAHMAEGRIHISLEGGSVCDVKNVENGPIAYRESRCYPATHPQARMEAALEPALAFVEEEEAGTHFGLQASPERLQSAFQEAPAQPPPRAPIGRRSTPRGAVIPSRRGGDEPMGFTKGAITKYHGQRAKRVSQRTPRTTQLPSGVKQEIPDSLMQMLGTDWKNMRATRVHDNRMTIDIDGVRFSVYTRRG